jgi:hypothetical protein
MWPVSAESTVKVVGFRQILIDGRPLDAFTHGGTWHPTPPWAPSEIRVSGDPWRVAYHDRLFARRTKASRLYGFAVGLERLIVVDPTLPAHEVADTLAHEYAHAVIASGRETEPILRKLTREQEEVLCQVWARELTRSGWRP